MTESPLIRVLILAQLTGMIVTFGHTWNMLERLIPNSDPVGHFITALFCSMGWPFYWSAWY